MGKLQIDATVIGDVVKSDPKSVYPCMDTEYREMRWVFIVDIEFANFSALVTYETETIKNLFSNRIKDVTYGGHTENNMTLLEFYRNDVPFAKHPVFVAEYTVVFSKEDP